MRIGILGPLEVAENGRPIEVGGARLRALLILLALDSDRLVPADRLIDDMWEDHPPAGAPNALQSLISRLRAAVGRDLIESRPNSYRLTVPHPNIDAHDFEARTLRARSNPDPAARSAELNAALALWRGPALADVSRLPFAEAPIARLEGLRSSALESRIEADLSLGLHNELIPELEALAAADPLREPLRVRLMRALYAAGRQAEALAVYEDTKHALTEALGVDPSPDLETTHLAILRQDPTLLPPPRPATPNGSPGAWAARPGSAAGTPGGAPAPGGSADPSGSLASGGASAPGGSADPSGSLASGGARAPGGASASDGTPAADGSGTADGSPVPSGAPASDGASAPRGAFAPDGASVSGGAPASGDVPVSGGAPGVGGSGAGGGSGVGVTPGGAAAAALAAVPELVMKAAEPVRAEAPPNNLRTRLTSFIGRDEDLKRVCELLEGARLVTLTGPGGAGKTRLSMESGDRLLEQLVDGVWFVELAPVGDPAEVPHAVLTALGLRETAIIAAGRARLAAVEITDPLDRLAAALGDKQLLILLDNCEHLLDAAAGLADRLLADCPGVRILATSREPLGITGESLWPVEPLALPPVDAPPNEAVTYPAVRLFADRGGAVRPGFVVSDGNVRQVLRICRALDGMPLAIELAAARLRALTAEQIAERLNDRFRLLTGGSRTALPRHQTLRAVVEWSWELLDDSERALWRRLSVFAGSATVESAEAVCADRPVAVHDGAQWRELDVADVFDRLSALVDKSLVLLRDPPSGGGGPRYLMLETIRAYGWEHLREAGEEDRLRRAHAEYFLGLAETAEPELQGHDQIYWLGRLAAEHDNLHAALRWATTAGEAGLAVRLCAALGWYWWLRGHWAEGNEAAAEVLAMPNLPRDKNTALAAALSAFTSMGDPREMDEVKGWLRLARDITASLGDEDTHRVLRLAAPLLDIAGETMDFRSLAGPEVLFDDPDPWVRSMGRFLHGQVAINIGRVDVTDEDFAIALEGFRAVGDRWGISFALTAQAELRAWRGEHEEAIALYEEAQRLVDELGILDGAGAVWHINTRLANELSLHGERDRAEEMLRRSLRATERRGSPETLAAIYHQFGEFARRDGDLAEANRRLARAEELATSGTSRGPHFPAVIAALRGLVDAEAGDLVSARKRHRTALTYAVEAMDNPIIATVLLGYADLAEREGDHARAAELLGAADGVRGMRDLSIPDAARLEASLRTALGGEVFTAVYEGGRATDLDAVLAQFGMERPTRTPL